MPASTCCSTAASNVPRSLGGFAQTAGKATTSEGSRPSCWAVATKAAVSCCASKQSSSLPSFSAASRASLSFLSSSALCAAWSCAACASDNLALATLTPSEASAEAALSATTPSMAATSAACAAETELSKLPLVPSAPAASLLASSTASWSLARTPSSASPIHDTSVAWCSCLPSAGAAKQLGATAASSARHSSGRASALPIASRTPARLGSALGLFCSGASCALALRFAALAEGIPGSAGAEGEKRRVVRSGAGVRELGAPGAEEA
mmetsp:Transcript_56695/g.151846  ORF Transcript_56695/g.151846 Transcript_56695/m.151846 type:complete len:267 (+) Transcript_56695:395-1195(+)